MIREARAHEAGMSLVSMLVETAIVGILAVTVSRFTVTVIAGAKAVNRIQEKEELRQLIRARLDCAKTKAHMQPGKNVVFYSSADKAIMTADSSNVMSLGGWRVTVPHPSGGGVMAVKAKKDDINEANLFKDSAPLICP
jgi:hypothetical protein